MPTNISPNRSRLIGLGLLLSAFAPGLVSPILAQEESSGYMEEDPNAPIDPRFERAQIYHLAGAFEDAFALYDLLLEERGEDAPVLITYGNMKQKIGDFQEAERRFRRAIEIAPKHIKARQSLGQLLFLQGRRTEAAKAFEGLLALDWIREKVKHSGHLNLGRIALLNEEWRPARAKFRILEREGDRANTKSGKRGQKRLQEMRKYARWSRAKNDNIVAHFHAKYPGIEGKAAREAMAADFAKTIKRVCGTLKIVEPEPWHLYLFPDDAIASQSTGRKEAHGWDYSWWINYSAADSGIDPKHTICCQLAARWAGSRPLSRMLVEGFACYLAGVDTDFHGPARKLLKEKRLRTMRECQILMRDLDEHSSRRCYNHGKSFVKFLIDTYGWEKFEKSWKHFNVLINAPRFKKGDTKGIEWQEAFDAIFKIGIGVTESEAEAEWRRFLAKE